MMIGKIKSKYLKLLVLSLLILFVFQTKIDAAEVRVSFNEGFVGDNAANNKSTNANYLTYYGWSKFKFTQTSTSNIFVAQGNDIIGNVVITDANNVIHTIPGYIKWRAPSGTVTTIVFTPSVSKTLVTKIGNVTGTYTIDANKYIGLTYIGSTLNIATSGNNAYDVTGNAATSGLLDDLNAYLASFQLSDPNGPVTVVSQTTTDQTPTISGSATLVANRGEVLTVIVNGVEYTTASGLTVNSGSNTWSLAIPSNLAYGTYEVTAIITNSDGYTLTDATANELVIIPPPTITKSGTLSAFTTCSGVASSTQTVTVSGANLTNNITLTAPTGYELSTSGSSYSNTVTLTQSGGTVSFTTIYVRLTSTATNGASGTISVTSTGATSQTYSISAATVNTLPTITLGATSSVSSSATSFSLPYTATSGSPSQYSISASTPALASFVPVSNASLSGSPISVAIPASQANTYGFNITVKNTTTGCVSTPVAFTQTITGPLITINGSLSTFTTCSGVASATQTVTVEGTNLGANVVLTAPTGYELSTDASSYSNTVTLTQSGGTVATTSIYVRLTSAAINGASGTISVTSTNATTKTFATGTAIVNAIPSITLGLTSNVSTSATSFNLPYTVTTGSPNQYSITSALPNQLAGFTVVSNATLSGTINVAIPASAANTYDFNLTVKNSNTGCESAPVAFTQTITQPTITTSGTLSAFTSCSGVASSTQTVTVSGVNLTNNITLTAPTDYELSTNASSYSNTVTLTQSGGTITSTTIYVRLTSAATNGASGTVSATSTGATSQTFSISAATVNALPTITLGATSSVSSFATSFNLPYTGTTGSPDKYSITNTTPVLAGFNSVTDASLSGTSSETITIPTSLANTYGFNITVKNSTTGCVSNPVAFTQTVTGPLITINGSLSTFTTCSGVASATQTITVEGANLGANVILSAPTGYELSADASSYSNTVTLTQSGGTITTTTIYVRLNGSATNGASGTISATSTNAYTQTIATGTAVVNAIPAITLGTTSSISTSATSFNLPYSTTTGSPNQYSITSALPNQLAGFTAVSNATLSGTITVSIPASAANTYNFNLTVKNSNSGCESAPVAFTQTITQPTITTSGTLSAFSTCSGVASSTQTITVSGVNLTSNISLTAPTGYELSADASSYSNTVTLTQSSGTVPATNIYVRLTSAAVNGASGTISVTSTGATSQTFATGTAVVNELPTITLNATTNVSTFATSFNLSYASITGSPNQYSISTGANALAGFTAVVNATLSSTVSVAIPASAANTYDFNLTVKNSTTGCVSAPVAFTQTIIKQGSNITVTGATTYTFNSSAQGPATSTVTGSTGAVTYSYAGTGSTTYGPSATPPTAVGTYRVIASVASDANYNAATSAAYTFTINDAPSVISINRVENTPTNLSTLNFLVTFSKDITGFDIADLTLINTGTVTTTSMVVSSITSSTYTVTVSGVSGNGTLGLNLKSSGTGITDSYGAGITNGIIGQVYTIDKITLTPSFINPATNDNFVGTSLAISINIPEVNLANSIRLTFAGISNTVIVTLNNGNGTISGNLNLNNLAASSIVASSSQSTLPSDIYTVTLAYQDYLGNPVASTSITNFKVNYNLPSTIVATGTITYTYNGASQGPAAYTVTGSTGAVTYSYAGTGSTTYGPSATPPTNVGTYQVIATLAADANYSGATSAPYAFTITAAGSTVVVTGATTYTYNASAQGPATNTSTGSTGAVTYSYVGTGSTTYGPSATPPTGVGTYQVIATLAADANYNGATSAPYAFTITAAGSTVVVTGATTYTFNGSAQGPATNTKTGSTGAVTYSYAGTGSTTYGPSATPPTNAGPYQVIATLAADANYSGATSAPYEFTITAAGSTVVVTGATTYTFNGSAQGPATHTKTGSTGAVTYSYAGTGSTTYGPSATPPTNAGTYQVIATLAADANYSGATSAPYAFTITAAGSTVVVTGATTYTFNGSAQGPATNTKTGSTGAVTYSYAGTGSTTYGPSATPPTGVGTYQVIATLAADANYNGATSAPYAFTITAAGSTVVVTGATTYTYNATAQGPATNTKTGSTGAVTYSYAGTGSTTYGPSATPPTGVGTYQVIATLAADANYSGATSTPYAFTITAAGSTVVVTGATTYTFNGSAQGPATHTKTGSTGAVTYSYVGTGSTTYGPSATLPTNAGTYEVVATLAADDSYTGATSTPYAFTINKLAPVISLDDIVKTMGDPNFTVSATSTSPGSITYTIANATIATVLSNTITLRGVGVTTITVTQAETDNYLAATTTATLTVKPAAPSVTPGSFIIGNPTNPSNTTGLISPNTGATLNFYSAATGGTASSVQPLPTVVGVYTFYVSQTINGIEGPRVPYTVTILPTVSVKSATFIIGAVNNPSNINSLITSIVPGSRPKWCNVSGTNCTDIAPTLPTTPGMYVWCVKAVDIATGLESAGCIYDTVTILAPATVMGVQKKASALTLQPDGSYTMDFTFTLTNNLSATLDSIQLIDNLSAVFTSPTTFKVLGVTATGTLVASNTFNGTSITNLLLPASKLSANKSETVVLKLQVMPQSYAGSLTNNVNAIAVSPYGTFGSPASTAFVIPAVNLFIADVITPNQDGKNDQWIIVKPSNKQLKVEIVNRWGQRVFASPDYQNNFIGRGTGSFLGQDLAEGTYFYFIEIVDRVTGVKEFRKGYLTLKR